MNELIKIIQSKIKEQRVIYSRFKEVDNKIMMDIHASKINILDEVLETLSNLK